MINVYLISSEIDGKRYYKIGHTRRKVEERIKEFRTGNVSDFSIIQVFQSKWGTKIESYFKRIYKVYNLSGEWFDLPEKEIVNFHKKCKLLDDNYNSLDGNPFFG